MHKIAVIGSQCAGKTHAAQYIASRFYVEPRLIKHAQPIYDANEALGVGKHRAFMQGFGDLAKKHFGQDIFLNLFKKEVRELEAEDHYDVMVNDDTRFKFEMKAIQDLGFVTIYIDAPASIRKVRAENLGLSFIEDHNSEIDVPVIGAQADIIIKDDGMNLTELYMELSAQYWKVIEPLAQKKEDEQ